MSDPYRPLFVEVPRDKPVPRFGALDMMGFAPVLKQLYGSPHMTAPQDQRSSMSET